MIDVIVVTYNSARHLPGALGPLREAAEHGIVRVTAVDNASTDGTAGILRSGYPWVVTLEQERNRGFAAATNAGIRATSGEYVLLMNPDVIGDPDAILSLRGILDADRAVGIAAPTLVNGDGSIQSAGFRFPTPWTQFVSRLPFGGAAERAAGGSVPYPADWALGAFLMLRRGMLDRVGLLDEGFFLYGEEKDLCRRTADAGWRLIVDPRVRVTHLGGGSTGRWNPVTERLFVSSQFRYFRKHERRRLLRFGLVLAGYSLARYLLVLPPAWSDPARRAAYRAGLSQSSAELQGIVGSGGRVETIGGLLRRQRKTVETAARRWGGKGIDGGRPSLAAAVARGARHWKRAAGSGFFGRVIMASVAGASLIGVAARLRETDGA